MTQPKDQSLPSVDADAAVQVADATFQQEVERLYRLTVYGRWLVVGILWLTLGSLSLWGLRYPIALILDYFTWAAVRYGLIFHRLPAIGLTICLGITLHVSFWQGRNLLLGLPKREQQRLEQQVFYIRQQGPSHPFWKLICQTSR